MYPIMTLSSFEGELYRSAFALKGHRLGNALSSFQRSLFLQPNPYLDASDSFQLPSADVLSSQGNGDFTLSHEPCQASLATFSVATTAQAFQPPRQRFNQAQFSKAKELDASVRTQLPTLLRL